MPPLMTSESIRITSPSLLKMLGNIAKAHLVVKPYFDAEFDIRDFLAGAKQAVQVVSSCLAGGDLDALQELFDPVALVEVERNLSMFTMEQRSKLDLNIDDMVFSFPYELGIMFNDKPEGMTF